MTQTETADVILLNKVDLADDDALDETEEIVRALNPRATVLRTEYGIVPLNKILGSAGGTGVVEAGIVDDHREAVEAASIKNDKLSQGSNNLNCIDPGCTDSSHSHSHNDHACEDADCTDSSHSHSHNHACADADCTDSSHSHEDNACTDLDCTDASHSHSHAHSGIGTYVYRSRRPFHPGRLVSFLGNLPVVRGVPSIEEDDESEETKLDLPDNTKTVLKSVLRSKGFVWCADSNVAALYWSHAGTSFDMQCLGRWWATLPRNEVSHIWHHI